MQPGSNLPPRASMICAGNFLRRSGCCSLGAVRDRCTGPDRGVREHFQPAARKSDRASEGNCRAVGARRIARWADPATANGKPVPGCGRRCAGRRSCRVDHPRFVDSAGVRQLARSDRRIPEPAHSCVHCSSVDSMRHRLWSRANNAGTPGGHKHSKAAAKAPDLPPAR
jgi:hypothetical protein